MPTFSYSQLPIVFLALMVLMGVALYRFFVLEKQKHSLAILMGIGFIIRFVMTMLDPFLHEWDERFHALVAKNMMDHPFTPMLKVHAILPYTVEEWCCNHIWLHKQPLFMWQMALSMKAFGVSEVAMRLPGVIMGTISIYFIYHIARLWTQNLQVAFLAAALFTFSYHQLELTSGHMGLDQNDLAFGFYVTASIWAFLRYVHSHNKMKWAVLVGIFAGCAILIKWLTGLLIFGGWGVYLLTSLEERSQWRSWRDLLLAIGVCCLVFVPWQWYIMHRFPEESAFTYLHNRQHITEVLGGHEGSMWYHLAQFGTLYGIGFVVFLGLGIFCIFRNKMINRSVTLAFSAMILVIYLFFSLIVKTKMQAFTFPVHALVWVIIAAGVLGVVSWLKHRFDISNGYVFLLCCCAVWYNLKFEDILAYRSPANEERNNKIYNTQIYKTLDLDHELKGRFIFNFKTINDIEFLFYRNALVNHWFPHQNEMDSLLKVGYKLAAFKSHNDQVLPKYILDNPQIEIIDIDIK